MNAPLRTPDIGSRDEMREFIRENLAMVRIQADLGATYADIRDDIGLNYAVRKLAAYMQAALATIADLEATKDKKGSARG